MILARCVHRTNRRAIAMMFVCLSISLSVCLGRVCIVIIRCILARIKVYGWIVQCSRYPRHQRMSTYSQPSFPVPPGREVGYECMWKLGLDVNTDIDKYIVRR